MKLSYLFLSVIDAVDFHVVLNGENHGNGDIICGPPSLGHDESENPKGEIISDVCKPLLYGQNDRENPKGEIVAQATTSSISKGSGNETIIEEQVEEETVELEFFDTTSVDKLKHTHNAYCPKCNSHITKVVLRRVKRERRIIIETHGQKSELLGCLSCFSVFVRIGIYIYIYLQLLFSYDQHMMMTGMCILFNLCRKEAQSIPDIWKWRRNY